MDARRYLDAPRGTVFALTAAVLIAGILLANAVLGYAWTLQSRTRQAHGEAIAAQIAAGLATYTRTAELSAERLVRDNAAMRGCTASTGRAQGACGLAADDPALDSVQFVPLGPLGIAGSDFAPSSLHSNLEISLVGATLTTGQTGAEVLNDGAHWVLAVAARAQPSDAGPGGVLVLRTSLDVLLKEVLLPDKPLGEYTLHAGGQRDASIIGAGVPPAPGADLYFASTRIPALQAGFRPDDAFLAATAVSGAGLLLPVLGGTVVVAVLVLFGFRQLQVQLRADAGKLNDAALYQRASTISAPTLYYAELAPLAESLVKVRRDAAAANRRPRGESHARETVGQDALEIADGEIAEGVDMPPPPDPEAAVPAEVFRDYDVRGHNRLLSPELALALGQAIGSEALERDCRSIVVGADGRETSPMLREQLVRGLLAAGMEVVDVGTLATPMLYFACHHLGTLSGVMVTGSHHPADHNGFKIMLGGETLCGERIAALRKRILEGRLVAGDGSYRVATIEEDYLRAVCDDVLVDKPLTLVVDCANGSASVVAVELFEALGCQVTPLFCELDGQFPNHAPDPSVPSNLRHLLSEVSARKADLGIAFDGDADRIGVVTGSGRVVTADRLMMLFASELLSRHPGADIVFDVKCSRDLAAVITRHGGRPIMWRSGHSWIKEKMKETGALLGGEFTGHICFKDRWYGFDDALYCAARLLELLCAESQTLDELVAALPHAIGTPEILVRVPQQHKFALMETVAKGIALEGARLSRIDGVRAEFADGWGLVRASNTADVLALRFEAQDERALARIQGAFREELRRLVPECELPF